MRHYCLYLIEDEVAETYFGEEAKLFYLFLEAHQTKSSFQSKTLWRQIKYITKSISVSPLEAELRRTLGYRKDYSAIDRYHSLTIPGATSHAELKLDEPYLTLRSAGDMEAETIFFEVLRQSERSFLAMDFDRFQYGWLNPVKQTSYIH